MTKRCVQAQKHIEECEECRKRLQYQPELAHCEKPMPQLKKGMYRSREPRLWRTHSHWETCIFNVCRCRN
jgi:hypothetical protein